MKIASVYLLFCLLTSVNLVPTTMASTKNIGQYHEAFSPKEKLSKAREIDVSKISIGKLRIGMNMLTVAKILGQPRQKRVENDEVCYGSYLTTLNYNKLEIGIFGKNSGLIYNIQTTNPSYATSEGIRVGDSISKAKKAYAKYQFQQDGEVLRYINQAYGGLSFKTSQGVITEIDLLSSSC
jgi:hypothetical protein